MKNYCKVLKLLFTADKKQLFKAMTIIVLLLGIEGGIPLYMNWMLEQVEVRRDIKFFVLLTMLFAVAYLLFCAIDSLRAEYNELLGKHILWKLREKIYTVLWKSNYLDNVSNNKERFKFVLTNETYNVFTFATVYSINLLVNLLTIIILFIPISIINPIISLVLLCSMIVTLFISFYSGKKILNNYEKSDDAREEDERINIETVDLVEATRVNGLGKYYLRKNKEALDVFIDVSAKSDRIEAFWTDMEKAIHSFAYIIIAGVMILSNNGLSGKLVTVLFITNLLLETSQQFQHQLQVLIKNIAVFDKVASVTDIDVPDGDDIDPIEKIEFDHIDIEYSEDQKVINDFNCKIESGDHVLVEGANGAGKSTLIKTLTGLITPTSGRILLNGKDMSKIDSNSLYKEICYVSQNELLLNESIEEYLCEITHRKISQDLFNKIKKFVKFKEEVTCISDNGNSLSGGEKKKLQMMKILINQEASVYVLDEIDAGLDAETRQILKLVEDEIMKDPKHIVIKISHIDEEKEKYNKVISL